MQGLSGFSPGSESVARVPGGVNVHAHDAYSSLRACRALRLVGLALFKNNASRRGRANKRVLNT